MRFVGMAKHLKLSFQTENGVFGAIGFGMGAEWGHLRTGERVDGFSSRGESMEWLNKAGIQSTDMARKRTRTR